MSINTFMEGHHRIFMAHYCHRTLHQYMVYSRAWSSSDRRAIWGHRALVQEPLLPTFIQVSLWWIYSRLYLLYINNCSAWNHLTPSFHWLQVVVWILTFDIINQTSPASLPSPIMATSWKKMKVWPWQHRYFTHFPCLSGQSFARGSSSHGR